MSQLFQVQVRYKMGSVHNPSARTNIQVITQTLDESSLFIERFQSNFEQRDETRESTDTAQTLYLESPSLHNVAYINDDSPEKLNDSLQENSFVLPVSLYDANCASEQSSPDKIPKEAMSPLSFVLLN